jgi:hypothetical protein
MTEPTEDFALDAYEELLKADRLAKEKIDEWRRYREEIQGRLKEILGDHRAGTLDGIVVVRYEPKDQFNGTAFKAAYPNLAKIYTRPVTVEKLDVEALKAEHPERYREFQVRALVNSWVPPVDEGGS